MSKETVHRWAVCALVLLSLGAAGAVSAQTAYGGEVSPGGRSVSFGTTTIDGKQWQRLAFRPEIPLGKLAIALDVELFINEQGGISSKGWEFGNSTEIANTLYRKIYYIRYGQPREPVFIKVGALDEVTLGYGFLMSRYRNTLDYPGVKNLGLQFELNPVLGFNVAGVLNNFQDINNGGPLVGMRVAKPWGPFEVGATLVYDVDQFGGMTDSDKDGVPDALDRFPKDSKYAADTDGDGIPDEDDRDADGDGKIDIDFRDHVLSQTAQDSINDILVRGGQAPFVWDDYTRRQHLFNKNEQGRNPFGVGGFDVAFKLIDRPNLRLITYGQMGVSLDDNDGNKAKGWGFGAPGLWLVMGPFQGRVEYRHLRDEFQPEYFDNLYDHTRAVANFDYGTVTTKDATLDTLKGQRVNGIFGDATFRLGNFVRFNGQYQYLNGDRSQQRLLAIAGLDEGVLQFVPKLSRVEAFYSKYNIGLYGDSFFERTVGTVYGYRVGFALGGGVEVMWSTRWLFQPLGADPTEVRSKRQVTLETVVRF